MTVTEIGEQGKQALARIPQKAIVGLVVLLMAGSYGLGAISSQHAAPVNPYAHPANTTGQGSAAAVETAAVVDAPPAAISDSPPPAAATPAKTGTATAATGTYVASKNGTKFYLPTCSGANRIKPENKIWFATEVEAKAAGYGPAVNCSGL